MFMNGLSITWKTKENMFQSNFDFFVYIFVYIVSFSTSRTCTKSIELMIDCQLTLQIIFFNSLIPTQCTVHSQDYIVYFAEIEKRYLLIFNVNTPKLTINFNRYRIL